MKNYYQLSSRHLAGILFVGVLLTTCSPGGQSDIGATPSSISNAESSASPSEMPAYALLWTPPDSDPDIVVEVEAVMQKHAAERSLIYERWDSLSIGEIPDGVAVLVVLSPGPEVGELATEMPRTRILALDVDGGFNAENVEIISLSEKHTEQAAFIAGFTAAVATEDWRVGVLATSEEEPLAEAFKAGVEFFCGSCISGRPPYNEYPQAAIAANAQDWRTGAEALLSQMVESVYLSPELEQLDVQQYFAERGVLLIGSAAPPTELSANWLASVGPEPIAALVTQLSMALEDLSLDLDSPLFLESVNAEFLSDTRVLYIGEVIADLKAGFIGLPSED